MHKVKKSYEPLIKKQNPFPSPPLKLYHQTSFYFVNVNTNFDENKKK